MLIVKDTILESQGNPPVQSIFFMFAEKNCVDTVYNLGSVHAELYKTIQKSIEPIVWRPGSLPKTCHSPQLCCLVDLGL